MSMSVRHVPLEMQLIMFYLEHCLLFQMGEIGFYYIDSLLAGGIR